MCGRYTLTKTDPDWIRARFRLDESSRIEEEPRFNIAPTDPVLAIRRHAEGAREAGRLCWGLVPGRWAERRGAAPLINARAETIASQPAFAESFRQRRCLIPADGFYEWRAQGDRKQPVWISRADAEPFAFAGVWAELPRAGTDDDALHSCAIVTCEPNGLVRPFHDRMPVILAPEDEERWLAGQNEDELLGLLRPLPDALLRARDVSTAVSDVRNDGPHLLEPPAEQTTLV